LRHPFYSFYIYHISIYLFIYLYLFIKMSNICPYCEKKVYPAESNFYKGKTFHIICASRLEREEKAAAPKVFAIHEQIFCNPEQNSQHKYPLAPIDGYHPQPTAPATNNCSKCKTEIKNNKFCTSCGTKVQA